jgi:type I phosphodiesterase/nucleotide pyrophosphatase
MKNSTQANIQTGPAAAVADPKKSGIHLFVLIDALGWEYLKGRAFLDDLLPYRRPLRTVLGFSSGAIPTILTGAWPSVTGHWNLFYYDPKGSPFWWLKYFSWVPDFVLNHRVPTKILQQLGRRVLGLGPLFDCCVSPSVLRWFNWVEKKNIYAHGGIAGASSIFDDLQRQGIPHRIYSYHDAGDAEIARQVQKDLKAGVASFYFVYLSEMDMFLHMHCTDEKALDERIAWYDDQLRKILGTAREMDPEATLTVLSDHGMTPVSNYFDLMKEVTATGYGLKKDYLAVYDSTMARFWFFNEAAHRDILAVLSNASCGRIVSDEELRALGVFFDDRRFGEVIFLLRPGWIFSKSDFNGPQWRPTGMHGYHPDDSYSDGIFLASQTPDAEINSIADVYRCMRKAAAELE